MPEIKFGPGGTAGLGYVEGLNKIHELGLSALEVEFTYGVRMSNSEAKSVGDLAKKLNISLSVHGPYYINLASKEKAKIAASIKRILDSCERAHHMGASPVVYHSGFFQKEDPKAIREKIIENTSFIMDKIKSNNWKTTIAPELTGKPTQFGSVDELLDLKNETGCDITIDFAHQKARNNGHIDYDDLFLKLKNIPHIHSHFSGIVWTPKGERNHILTDENDIKELLFFIKKYNKNGTIINESPDPIGDAKKMMKSWEKIS